MNTISQKKLFFLFILSLAVLPFCLYAKAKVTVGADEVFNPEYMPLLKGKRVGLITNQTAINAKMQTTMALFKEQAKKRGFTLAALFAPEHGITGVNYASEDVVDEYDPDGIPIYSLHGKTRRPTDEMLKNIDILVYDIQDIGSRSYTFISTLFYVMEAAVKKRIAVIVLDRPNPINGITIDGPMMEEKWRSIVGYINVPYCHGMTIGELALFFNSENKVGCQLHVIPMKGWKRAMSFDDTGLPWVPTSPNVPEASTAWYYPTTGFIGELQLVNIGIGYTLPFKLIGAPWINAQAFAKGLNSLNLPGVHFQPFYYRPFYGRFAHENCQGVNVLITDRTVYKPVSTQYAILSTLKKMYSQNFRLALDASKTRKDMFCKVNGTEEVYRLLCDDPQPLASLLKIHVREKERFNRVRESYLLSEYQ